MKQIGIAISLFILSLAFNSICAQELLVKNSGKGPFLDHKVQPKENFYSVGRLYAIPPKEIAAYNSLDMNKGLNIGQVIRIPLTAMNYSQTTGKGTPVYYKPGEKQTLQKISSANNNVSTEHLKQWNGLTGDAVAAGTKVIVGYLMVGETAAAIPTEKKETKQEPVAKTTTPPPVQQPAAKVDTARRASNEKTEKQVKANPVTTIRKDSTAVSVTKPKPIVTEKQDKSIPVTTVRKDTTAVAVTKPKSIVTEKQDKSIPVTTVRKDSMALTVTKPKPITSEKKDSVMRKPDNADQGYFRPLFDQQVKAIPAVTNQTLTAGIFKTASGWQDSKYYLLIDGVKPGMIVRITNPDNNKSVYAKVLGEMGGIRQNEGLNLRISNAAASVLQVNSLNKFMVKVNY